MAFQKAYKKYMNEFLSTHQSSQKLATALLLIILIAASLWVRVANIGVRPLWVDEAESSINALTILKHGLPIDSYLGLPIYENILIQKWPENEEYEFRDISYSDLGVSIYHGWLPIYSMAVSLALFKVKPDEPTEIPSVRHADKEIRKRTIAPRLPSVLFSLIFLVLLFQLARDIGGPVAGWVALIVGSFHSTSVWFGSQARYYSATLMLVTLCALAIWRMVNRGRLRDFLLGGISLVLLFHTHMLACAVMVVMMTILSPLMIRNQHFVGKALATASILAAGSVPWILLTDFFSMWQKFPKALHLINVPTELWSYLANRSDLVAFFGPMLFFAAAMIVFRDRLPKRLWEPFMRHRLLYVLLLTWFIVGHIFYILITPAASYYLQRASLLNLVPGILLSCLILADVCCVFTPRGGALLAVAIMLIFLSTSGRLISPRGLDKSSVKKIQALITYLRNQSFERSTKLYSYPNFHLVLQYYTGLPVQSIAPVRKAYLDSYEGTEVFIEQVWLGPILDWKVIQKKAQAAQDDELKSESEARRWAKLLRTRAIRKELKEKGHEIDPPLKELPEYLEQILETNESEGTRWIQQFSEISVPQYLLLREFTVKKHTDWWQILFYRFVNPLSRCGRNSNYATRMHHAKAVVLSDAERIVYYSPSISANQTRVVNQ